MALLTNGYPRISVRRLHSSQKADEPFAVCHRIGADRRGISDWIDRCPVVRDVAVVQSRQTSRPFTLK